MVKILGERIVPLGVIATVSVCLTLGLAAALFGGLLSSFGDGPGGLSGIPGLLLILLALVGIVGALGSSGGLMRAAIVLSGPLLVAVAFFFVAHGLDPCVTGAWDLTSEVRGAPACQYYGPYLNVAPRFHLLMHALTAVPAALLYWFALRRVLGRQSSLT